MSALKTALVTGSTSGIGRATAITLAAQGIFVVISGRDQERGQAAVDTIRSAGGSAALILKDLSLPEGPAELAREATEAAGGQIDILINNAAAGFYALAEMTTVEDFERVFVLNTRAPALLTGALAPAMAQRGRGVIINVTAVAAQIGQAGLTLFGASKAALGSMTRTWAAEYGSRSVRVNAAEIGAITTPDNPGATEVLETSLAVSRLFGRAQLKKPQQSLFSLLPQQPRTFIALFFLWIVAHSSHHPWPCPTNSLAVRMYEVLFRDRTMSILRTALVDPGGNTYT
ncbi:hypothetical protein G7Z17_g3196 [Cylindrodendrum hubeiense]|uniref:3-oxoacyl-[acyl-carrier-protein] reductase n=1 Tax=Cylindrodendrum hubeiense TaxID=595255 RepID=A0A9P5HJG3_9HYPO|nr:hypothetical protein G7Z17_g3196 [Cylindrodendrum hubeiense]